MSVPTFSIIVPIYNIEKYLEECILSILNQSYGDFELILVNDGSTDNCRTIAQAYLEKDNRIKLINKENQGLMRARNSGLELATGRYIVNVDGDDCLQPQALELLSDYISKYNADVYCFGHFDNYPDYNTAHIPPFDEGLYVEKEKEHIYERMIYDKDKSFFTYGLLPSVWSRIVKRELFEKIRLSAKSDIEIGEDFATTLPIMLCAESIYIIKKPLYSYRILQSSMSHKFNRKELIYVSNMLKWFEECEHIDMQKYDVAYQLGAFTVDVVYNHLMAFAKNARSRGEFCEYASKLDKTILKYIDISRYEKKSKGLFVTTVVKRRFWGILWIYAKIRSIR